MLKLSASLLCAQVAFATTDEIRNIAGYVPGTSVVDHSLIDLDQDEIANGPTGDNGDNFTNMIHYYSVGNHSVKGSGAIRTIQGFSTGLYAKACPDDACYQPWFEAQYDYFQDESYGDTIVSAALEGTGLYASQEISFRKEVATKGAAYLITGMYASHEMEDAIQDCEAGDIASNDDGVHAWDEAVAFYAGSLEGTEVGGNTAGELQYRLAEKRCDNFNTCGGAAGESTVNSLIFESFDIGRDALTEGDCDTAAAEMVKIQSQFLVPQIQGTLRYAFKCDPAANDLNGIDNKTPDVIGKEQGEGFIFSQGIIGHVNKCDPVAAAVLVANLDISVTSNYMSSGYVAVKEALESVYECLGITCADIGGLLAGDDTYYEGLEPCSEETTQDSASALAPLSALAVAGFSAMMQ